VPALFLPGLEVHSLGRADAEQDSQDLWMGYSLGQCWVEAGAALLDKAEMERRRVGDRLNVIRGSEVGIASGDCRKFPGEQAWDRLRELESWAKIRVMGAAAIPRPPTGVDGELHEIGEPFFCFVGPCRLTALQRAKLIEVNLLCALRLQIGVDEGLVADLILGIVVDILIHVPIEILQRLGVGRAPAAAGDFFILDSSEFVVLAPEIALNEFNRGQESQDRDIALGKRDILGDRVGDLLRNRAQRGARDRTGPQKATPVSMMFVCHVRLLRMSALEKQPSRCFGCRPRSGIWWCRKFLLEARTALFAFAS
jgi:hypothetical protein